MSIPVFVEFMAGTAGLDAGLGSMMAKMQGVKAESEASMAGVGKLGMAMSAGVVAAAGVLAVESVKMAGDFQASVTKLGTTAGEAQGSLKMVGDGMLDMAGQVGISAQDLAKGMYTVESSGQHGAQALDTLKASAEGAKQEQADLGHVTDAVSTIMHDYGPSVGDAATVTSKLVAAVSHGKTTFDELTGAMHSVTPLAAAAGISLADVTGSLSAMTASGMSADQASQNLGHAIQSLSVPTQPMIKEMSALGLNAVDLSHNLGKTGVAGTLQEVAQAIMTKMGPAGTVLLSNFNESKLAVTAASNAFGSLPPAAQKVAEAIDKGTMSFKEFRKTGGGLDVEQKAQLGQWNTLHDKAIGFSQALRSGANQNQNFTEAMKRATGTTDGMNVALQLTGEHTDAVNASIKDIAGSTKQMDGNIKGWSEVQGNFNQQMDELHATLGALVTKLGIELLPTVTKVAEGFKTGITWVTEHKAAMIALAAVIGGALIVALAALSVALWTIATNPVTLIIAGIIAAVVLLSVGIYELWTHWHQIWGWITGVATSVWHYLVSCWESMKNDTLAVWHAVTSYISGAWNDMTHAVMTGVHAVGDTVVGGWNDVKNFTVRIWNDVLSYLAGRWSSMTNTVTGAWNKVKSSTLSAWNAVTAYLAGAWNDMTHAVMTGVTAVVGPVVGAWHWVENITSTVWNGIKAFFEKWWPLLLVVFAPPIALLIGIWNHFHEQITAVVVGVWNGVKTFLSNTWNWIKDTAQTAWNLLRDYIITPVTEFSQWVGDKIGALAGWLLGKWNEIKDTAQTAWNLLRDYIITPVTEFSQWVGDKIGALAGWLETKWLQIKATAELSWRIIHDTVLAIVDSTVGWLMDKWSAATGWLSGKWNEIVGIARGVWTAAYNDVVGIWNEIVGAVENAAGRVLGAITGQFVNVRQAIWAPIRAGMDDIVGMFGTAEQIGNNLIMGMIRGVKGAAGQMVNAVKGVANSALDGAKSLLGISSPSKVFADEIGVHIPAGIAQGILANSGVLSTALASVTGPITGPQFSAGGGPGATFGATMPGGGQQPIIVNITGTYYGFGGASQAAADIRDELLKLQQRTPLGFRAS